VTGLRLVAGDAELRVAAERAVDLSIPLDFDGPQPNHFGAPPARARPLAADGFVGDTRRGGSCNCDVLELTPHCNGTHTECVGHVTGERLSVAERAREPLLNALVLSVETPVAEQCDETADPAPQPGDRLVTAAALHDAAVRLEHDGPTGAIDALVIRTLPNDETKRHRRYEGPELPPFLSLEAIAWIVGRGVRHLLVDLPSVDRSHDEGRLAGHRAFWGLPPGATTAAKAKRPEATITELIYAPDDVPDGRYGLSLQIAPFRLDAAPSRPLLFPLENP
jgi:kynurenine formamidase